MSFDSRSSAWSRRRCRMNMRSLCRAVMVGAMVGGLLSGCGPGPLRPDLSDSDPAAKIPAMVRLGGAEGSQRAQPTERAELEELVRSLLDEDPAVRLYASETLQRISGRDFEYRYYAPEPERRIAGGAVAAVAERRGRYHGPGGTRRGALTRSRKRIMNDDSSPTTPTDSTTPTSDDEVIESVQTRSGAVVVRLRGDVTLDVSPLLRQSLLTLIEEHAQADRLRARPDAGGLRELVRASRCWSRCTSGWTRSGVGSRWLAPSERVRRLLEIVKLDKLFCLYENVEEAVEGRWERRRTGYERPRRLTSRASSSPASASGAWAPSSSWGRWRCSWCRRCGGFRRRCSSGGGGGRGGGTWLFRWIGWGCGACRW